MPSVCSWCAARATGSGNYVSTSAPATTISATARSYNDFGLFTVDEQIGADVADMFNYLTGYGRPLNYRRVLTAPNMLRDGIIAEIERTVEAHREGRSARIAMKMNALVDGRCIRALYAASQAGVKVDSNVRGICCLRLAAGDPREHPGRLDRRAAALLTGIYTRARRRADRLHRLGRPDAAQPRPSRRAGGADLRSPSPGGPARHARTCLRRQPELLGLHGDGAWTCRAALPGERPCNMQLELDSISSPAED